jgi:peptidyl-tRNA hydrolase, PTH1 family
MLIVGLGNPGDKYENTRHNVGFMVLDLLAKKLDASFSFQSDLQADVTELNVDGTKVILAKPMTFMNLSGEAASKLASKYKVETGDIWTVYDDVDLDFSVLRVRDGGSAGGHNGVKSLIQHLDENFIRFRVGIGATPEKMALEDWVLSKFTKKELEELENVKELVVGKILEAIKSGINITTENA